MEIDLLKVSYLEKCYSRYLLFSPSKILLKDLSPVCLEKLICSRYKMEDFFPHSPLFYCMKTFYFPFQSFIFLCHDQISNEIKLYIQSSVQFSHSVMSNSLQPHGLQHSRLPCPSPTPGALYTQKQSSKDNKVQK